jgi:predicted PurR-regulated permease PerM
LERLIEQNVIFTTALKTLFLHMPALFNNRIRQVILLLIIILLAFVLTKELFVFFPGLLGAITLYILQRESYFKLTLVKRWNKTGTALLYIMVSLVLFAVPIFLSIQLLSHKVVGLVNNPTEIIANAKLVGHKVELLTGIQFITDSNILSFQKQLASFLPGILNSTANIVSNLAIMFFLLYYLLTKGREVERFLNHFIPLKEENVTLLGEETKNMVKANAIGIPILAIIQGVIATLGYWMFSVEDPILWGFLTAICSMIPIVGTALIWVPITAWLFASGNTNHGIWLLIYALVIITNIDYVARLSILRSLMDVHPLVTIFGVIVGLGLFGFWGVIFGPLLISYFIILIKIYMNEFGKSQTATTQT